MVIFRKGKVLPQLQENLVKFCFDNLVISSPLKCELAEECSGRDYIDISVSYNTSIQSAPDITESKFEGWLMDG